MKLSENDGTEEGRGGAASGPAYANPPRAASKSGRQAATAEEWAAFSHRERSCEGGNGGAEPRSDGSGEVRKAEMMCSSPPRPRRLFLEAHWRQYFPVTSARDPPLALFPTLLKAQTVKKKKRRITHMKTARAALKRREKRRPPTVPSSGQTGGG